MKINKINIHNFKGLQNISLEINSANYLIAGPNAAGKSSIMDAWCWLLFGKDSHGDTDFSIKPRDDQGQEMHNLTTVVHAEIIIDSKTVILEKQYFEKWTKRRGEAKKVLTGHTTKYLVDDVVFKKKEYDSYITENIGDYEQIRLLSDVSYFLESLHWTKRKEALLEMSGFDVKSLYEDERFVAVPALLGNATVDQVRKTLRDKKRLTSKEMEAIPHRIDELTNISKPDVPIKIITKAMADLDKELQKLQQQSANKGAVASKQAAIQGRLRDIEDTIKWTQQEIETKKSTLKSLRQEWDALVEGPADEICSCCGQTITGGDVWKKILAAKLTTINKQGKTIKESKEALEEKLAGLEKKKAEIQKRQGDKQINIDLNDLKKQILAVKDDLAIWESRKAEWKQYEKAQGRIKELEAQQKEYAAKLEQIEEKLYLLELFDREKASRIEESVNDLFDTVNFRLFEEQVNGGIKEICEAYVGGVPYSDLNTASKINAGIECVKVLSDHYKTYLPIWIDRAESVIDILPTPKNQQIILKVEDCGEIKTKCM